MALTQSDLDALDSAIVASELEVEIEGKRTRYRSIAELMAARAHAANVISQGTASAYRPTGSFRFDMTGSRD